MRLEVNLEELDNGKFKIIDFNNMRIAICKINERVFAFEDRCSHEDFPLSRGELESNERFCITCALHGSKFDLESGKPLNLPAVLPIKVFKTEVKGDKVIVILDE